MSLGFLQQLAGQVLGSATPEPDSPLPDRLIVRPPDLWPGSAEKGQALMNGVFTFQGQSYAFPDPFQFNIWAPPGMNERWMAYLHGFSWLRDLRAAGGEVAARAGFTLMDNWCRRKNAPLSPAIMGERLSHWIAHADFFVPDQQEDFRDIFFAQIMRQGAMIQKAIVDSAGLPGFQAAKGLLYAGLALEGREGWIENSLTTLDSLMEREILRDGGPISRSPATLFSLFQILLDARTALTSGGYPVPETIESAIERAASALKFFRLGNGTLAGFHGPALQDTTLLDQALNLAVIEGKLFQSLPQSGFERLAQGRSCLLFDTGAAAPSGYDREAHAAPLAFEFTYGKDTVFTACGHEGPGPEWSPFLRGTAAHTALCLDQRNACEILENGGFGRKNRRSDTRRMDTKTYLLAEATQDGYEGLNGLVHKRRLYLGDKGHDLRGEDTLTCTIGRPLQASRFDLRFHLHPRSGASLIQGGAAALIRLPSGSGWRFQQQGGSLSIEESIHTEPGQPPRKSSQLAISGIAAEAQTLVKWALQREGI